MSEETIREICRLRSKDLSIDTIARITGLKAEDVKKAVDENKEIVSEYKDFNFRKEAE